MKCTLGINKKNERDGLDDRRLGLGMRGPRPESNLSGPKKIPPAHIFCFDVHSCCLSHGFHRPVIFCCRKMSPRISWEERRPTEAGIPSFPSAFPGKTQILLILSPRRLFLRLERIPIQMQEVIEGDLQHLENHLHNNQRNHDQFELLTGIDGWKGGREEERAEVSVGGTEHDIKYHTPPPPPVPTSSPSR